MRLLLLTITIWMALPADSQNFTLQLTGGSVTFGSGSAIHIKVASPSGGGTAGHLSAGTPPAVVLTGREPFRIIGSTLMFGQQWNVEFVFPGPPFANQGNLSSISTNWELTGKYRMIVQDSAAHIECSEIAGLSGEYQFAGPPLSGWPHNPKKPTDSPGQSPGLTGLINLRGRANIVPTFVASSTCPIGAASQWNTVIGKQGFDVVALEFKLTY